MAPRTLAPAVGRERAIGASGDTGISFRPMAGGFGADLPTHAIRIDRGGATFTPIAPSAGGPQVGDAFALATLEVASAGDRIDAAARAVAPGAGGSVVIDRGAVEELWRNGPAGAEQAWQIAGVPHAQAALTITVAATGEDLVRADDAGLHFVGPSGVGLRYSHAIWLDARGVEWRVPATYDQGRIQLVVPASVVAATVFPATLDPTIEAEVAIDAPVAGTTGADAVNPAVAFDGTDYLVVWSDARDGTDRDIWGVRVDPSGALLDPSGIKIASSPGVQAKPVVAFAGGTYVVAWEDYKVSGGTEADVAAATVSTAGVVTAIPAPATSFSSETTPAIVARGNGALLAWVVNGQVDGALFDGAFGNFGAPFAITSGTNAHKDPAVAADPAGNYLVAFTETAATTGDDARGQLVDPTGALVGAAFNISAGNGAQMNPAASFDGTDFDVVWSELGADIYGTRVSTAGAVLDTRTVNTTTVGGIAIDTAAQNQEIPSVACSSGGCLVAWQDKRNVTANGYDVYGQVLTTSFTKSGTDFAISAASFNQIVPRVVATPGGYFAAWQDLRSDTSNAIYGARLASAGAVSDPGGLALVAGTNSEYAPAAGRSGTTVAIGWADSRSLAGNEIDMARFDASGTALDAVADVISAGPNSRTAPAVAGDGNDLVFAWTDTRNGALDIYAARADAATGAVLDPSGIAIATAKGTKGVPAVASSGNEALIVWQDGTAGTSFDIDGAILTGGTASAPFVISNATGDQLTPAVAWDDAAQQYVVAWTDARNSNGRDIYAARVTPAGAVLDASGVLAAVSTTAHFHPRVASANGVDLIVYEDNRNGNRDIYGTRVTAGAALTVLDAGNLAICTDPAKQITPTVAALGSSFVVAWTDPRGFAATADDIYGQLVGGDGSLIGGNFVISANPDDETAPAAIDASGTRVVVTYDKQRTDLDARRVVSRSIDGLMTITVAPADPTIAKATTQAFTATGTYPDGSTADLTTQVTWTSSDGTVATISNTTGSQGVASGLAQGTTTITATLGVVSGSTTLTVGPPALVSIALTPANPTIAKGQTQAFTATGTYGDGSTGDVTATATWSAADPLVATMAGNVATGAGQGATTITATVGTVSGTTTLTVGPPVLVSIGVTPANPSIAKGTTQQFTATGVYSDSSTADLTAQATWTSSTTTVATIAATGLASAVGTGSTTITATFGGFSDSTTLTVTAATLSTLTVTPVNATIAVTTTVQYTATGVYSDGTSQDLTTQVTWSSSDGTVATISNTTGSNGLATAVGPGPTTIGASLGTVSDSTTLTVTAATLQSIAVTPANPSIAANTTQAFTATGTFSDGSTQDLTTQVMWGSSLTTVATISNTTGSQGVATGVGAGTTTISATLSGVTGSTTLTVTGATLVSIAVTPVDSKLPKTYKLQFTATGTYSDGTTQNITTSVTWASSTTTVASISNAAGSKGLASANAPGTTTISATLSGVTGSTTLTVTNAVLRTITISPSTSTIPVLGREQLTATGHFSDGSTLNITGQAVWKSSDKKTASVTKSGLVSGVKKGTVTITATWKTITGSASVTVR